MPREFEMKPAAREASPLMIGIAGPSGSGKTYSALRLATGIQRVTGGEIGVIDTEAKRALHYAETFRFQHMDMRPPFSPLDFLDAINFMVAKQVRIIVVDNMSHEHSGQGGVLDQINEFLDRKCGDDEACRNKNNMLANKRPKEQRKILNDSLVQLGSRVSLILLYRAQDKVKPIPGQGIKHIGWQPETTSPLVYDMTARFLLPPASDGKPNFSPEEQAEKMLVKNPEQFKGWFKGGLQLDEELGEKLARWAAGPIQPPPVAADDLMKQGVAAAQQGVEALKSWWESIPPSKLKTSLAQNLKEWREAAQATDDSK